VLHSRKKWRDCLDGRRSRACGHTVVRGGFPFAAKFESRLKNKVSLASQSGEGLAVGLLLPYPTGPGFSIVPVVAKAAAPVAFKINLDAVIEAFEVPFAFVMMLPITPCATSSSTENRGVPMRCPMARGTFGA